MLPENNHIGRNQGLHNQWRREWVKAGGGYFGKLEKDVVQCESVPETIEIGPTYCKFFSLMRNVEKFCHFQPIFTKKPNFDIRSQIYK
jgi:hypothetical protein